MKTIAFLFIILLSILIIIPVGTQSVLANSFIKHKPTFKVLSSPFIDKIALNNTINYWHQYGFELQKTDKDADVLVKFSNYCYGDMMGTYNTTAKLITVYTGCNTHQYNEVAVTRTTEHEFGHFLGFDHYSDPSVMDPFIDWRTIYHS